jgi:hypothetical protein
MIDMENEGTGSSNAEERAGAMGTAVAATAMRQDAAWQQAGAGVETTNYAAAGEVFTNWFNRRIGELTKPTIRLGAKTAEVIRLHEDGRLECEVEAEGSKNAQVFVAFEATYLDQLLRRITALGL